MFEKLIRFSIEQRWLVLLAALGMAALGVFSYQKLPIDAVPDITNVQVQINTQAAGYSPLETEQRVTYPIETVMAGLPNLEQTRSLSRYGLSQVTVILKTEPTSILLGSSSTSVSRRRATSCLPASRQRWGPSRPGWAKSISGLSKPRTGRRSPTARPIPRQTCARFRTGSSSHSCEMFLA